MIYEAMDIWNSPSLQHHGVKGMKWGVRKVRKVRDSISSALAKPKQKRYARSDYRKAKSMSNQELQERINRINLEQNYINAIQRDRAAYKDATDGVLMKWGRRTTSGLYNKFINSGNAAVDIGGQLTRNAVINSANKIAPVTRKPKK